MRYLFGQEFHNDRVCFVNRKPMELGEDRKTVTKFNFTTACLAEFREMMREIETNTDRPTVPSKVYTPKPLFGLV